MGIVVPRPALRAAGNRRCDCHTDHWSLKGEMCLACPDRAEVRRNRYKAEK